MLIDTHAHLDFPDFDDDRDAVIARAAAEGVGAILTVGTDIASSGKALAIAQRRSAVFCAVGVHPNESTAWRPETATRLRELADNERVVAIGETGLDFYRDTASPGIQRKAFAAQIDLALEFSLPIIIHSRESIRECIDILRAHASPPRGVFHCFSADEKSAKEALDLGFMISFAGTVSFRNAGALRQVVRTVPLDRVLVETDCPFLAPEPVRGHRNEPAYVRHTAKALAEAMRQPLARVAAETTANARRLFSLHVDE